MRTEIFASAALAAAAFAAPAAAADGWSAPQQGFTQIAYYDDDDDDYYRGRVWRDRHGRYRCRRDDGTVGLLVGGGVGALIGREIDGGRNRATGTIIGGVAGALIGREIDRSNSRCR